MSCAGVYVRSAVPASPVVHSTYVTMQPAATHLATTPPEPISASSGWAKITIARSGTWVTTSSFRAAGSANGGAGVDRDARFWVLALGGRLLPVRFLRAMAI